MIKSAETGAVLNTDKEALNKYKLERKYYQKIDKLVNDVEDIKTCLGGICDRIKQLEQK